MLKIIWLLFSQTVTVTLSVLFTLSAFKPEWLPTSLRQTDILSIKQSPLDLRETLESLHYNKSCSKSANPSMQNSYSLGFEANDSNGFKSTIPNPAQTQPYLNSYSQAAKTAIPSVVNVLTTNITHSRRNQNLFQDPFLRRFFNTPSEHSRQTSLASGVIASESGYILTNHHVINQSEEIEVLLDDKRRLPAKLVGSDPETDLAILKVEAEDLHAIEFTDSEKANVGDIVLAIGNPFGVGQTVTMGIISGLGRSQLGINTFENFIQTDAAINPGNSGGALVDISGKLLGINTAIYSKTGGSLGIGFAIPTSTVKSVMDQIITTGYVTRGYIGVEPQDLNADIAQAFKLPRETGVILMAITKNSPADRAGVHVGDIVVKIDQQTVLNTTSMLKIIADLPVGKIISFSLIRNHKNIEIPIRIGKRPSSLSFEE